MIAGAVAPRISGRADFHADCKSVCANRARSAIVLIVAIVAIFAMYGIAMQPARAGDMSIGAGYNFIPGSDYVSFDDRWGNFAAEALLMTTGQEEPTTRPGPELDLNLLAYLPSYPVFAKVGVISGLWGKRGADAGFGIDWPFTRSWSVRLQDTFNWATEDQRPGYELEHQIALGVEFHF